MAFGRGGNCKTKKIWPVKGDKKTDRKRTWESSKESSVLQRGENDAIAKAKADAIAQAEGDVPANANAEDDATEMKKTRTTMEE